jgi:hypothetical protein
VELGVWGGLLEIQYAAAGFLHVRREVFEKMSSQLELPRCTPLAGPPFIPYFLPLVTTGNAGSTFLDADFAFCERARHFGFAIFADTTIRLWRNGTYRYSWEDLAGGTARTPSCELRVASTRGAPAEPASPTPSPREPYRSPELDAFRRAHPWPELKPAVSLREREGWLFPSSQKMLARFLSNET